MVDAPFWWEDIVLGATERSSTLVVTEAEIIDFARKFDPLPIHIDPVAASASPFGGVIAAGSHMLALKQILVADFSYCPGVIVSMGHDEVRFLKPLRGGSTLQVLLTYLEKRPSASKPDRGSATIGLTLTADGEAVMRLKELVLMRRKPVLSGHTIPKS